MRLRIAKVQSRLEGWIDRVLVDFTGKYVKAGDPLLTIYSPEVVASEQEDRFALSARHLMNSEQRWRGCPGSRNLVAAGQRLKYGSGRERDCGNGARRVKSQDGAAD